MFSRVCLLVLCCIGIIKISGAQNSITADFDRTPEILEVRESDGFAEVCVVLSGALTSPASFIVNANTDIGASPGEDYEILDEVTLSFEVSELRKCINITILQDGLEEGNVGERIGVQLFAGSSSAEDDIDISIRLFQVSILDSDVLLLGFTQTIYEVVEAGTQAVCVRILNGSLASGVNLRVSIEVNDGLNSDRSVVISSDPAAMNCEDISIIDDEVIEEMQTLTLTLLLDGQDSPDVLFEGTATLRVEDNDGAEVELQDTEFQLLEGDLDTQRNQDVCIVLVNDLGGLRRDIVLSITSSSDNATSGVDFVPLNMNLTIPTGATVNHEVCFQFTIIGDDQREEDENFSITLAPITPDIIDGESVVNVIIMDDNDTNDCRTLPGLLNGMVFQPSNDFGGIATYTCEENFALIPAESASRTCMDNDWSGQDPACVARCSFLTLENGVINGDVSNAVVGSEVVYSCMSNFELEGFPNRVCQDGGVWSGEGATCELITCDPLSNPENGGFQLDGGTMVGAVATYTCQVGYFLEGDEMRVCEDNRLWSGEEPTCNGATGVMSTQGVLIALLMCFLALTATVLH